jgi:hypothetical protein
VNPRKSITWFVCIFALCWICALVFGYLVAQRPNRYQHSGFRTDPKIGLGPAVISPGEELRVRVHTSSGFVLEGLEIFTDDGRWNEVLLDEDYRLPSCLDFRGETCTTIPERKLYYSVRIPEEFYSGPYLNLNVRAQGVKATIDEILGTGPDTYTFLWEVEATTSRFRLSVDHMNRKWVRWIVSIIAPSAAIMIMLASLVVKGGFLKSLPRDKRALLVLVPLVSGILAGSVAGGRYADSEELLGAFRKSGPLDILFLIASNLLVMAVVLLGVIVVSRLISVLIEKKKSPQSEEASQRGFSVISP